MDCASPAQPREVPALSPRELECLLWVSRGKSSADIGQIVGLSPRTVDSYLEKTCAKLRVRTRTAQHSNDQRRPRRSPPFRRKHAIACVAQSIDGRGSDRRRLDFSLGPDRGR